MTDQEDRYDSVERVEQLAIGASIKISCKRGTDVRDDDSVSINANFETIEELRSGSEELAQIVIGRMESLRGFRADLEDQEE